MPTDDYSRPDDRELLRASMRALSGSLRPVVLFGGLIDANILRLTDFLGTSTVSLHNLNVTPGIGLGGHVFLRGRPNLVSDYIASDLITHDYDFAVNLEHIRSMAAVPVVVRGRPRSVLYIGSRDSVPLGARAVDEAMEAAARIAAELLIRDEVDRRLGILNQARAQPAMGYDRAWVEEVRLAHAELRSLASTVENAELAAQLQFIGGRLSPAQADVQLPAGNLSRRELDVLAQIGLGCSYQETADRLALKPGTVKSYLQNAMAKLSAHNGLEAVSAARRLGLIP